MSEAPSQNPPRRRIKFRRVSVEQVGRQNVPLVFCPRKAAVLRVEDCRRCGHFSGLCINSNDSGAFLRCAFADEHPVVAPADAVVDDSGSRAHPGRALVSEIMTSPVRSATLDMSLEDLAALFLSEKLGALPVVDARGRPIGITTKTDVLERYYDHAESEILVQASAAIEHGSSHAPAVEQAEREVLDTEVSVRDVMTYAVFSVAPSASISRVAALMAYEHVHHILVVDSDGGVLGIVSSLDIARWLAYCDGYVVPKDTRWPSAS